MVALDGSHGAPGIRGETARTGETLLFALLIAALLAAASLVIGASDGGGWALAAEMVSRFSLLVFVAAMAVEPAGRLLRSQPTIAAARERPSLVLAFVAVSAVSLLCVAAPSWLGGEPQSLPSVAYCILTASILAVMLFSAHPGTRRFLGGPAWRAMQRIATSYFWLVFALTGIGRLIGPHRPDYWHGFALLLLVGVLLFRFADTFVTHWRVAEKVG
ncbi:MAG TPA: hypothetical protein VJ476_09590 [Rhizomicrobium sp.]|nr:hypothetical protein [Rhizomicrobium sp.]